ncbi:MAG: phospho-N-acetylmuramoyl-pentapeptide-transferase [Candidatus Brocadiia bacterium]
MLNQLISPFIHQFRYITFRAGIAAVCAFLLCVILMPWLIRYLKKRKISEHTEKKDSEQLKKLHANKSDTPTMGGVVVILILLLLTVLLSRLDDIFVINTILAVLGLALLGYWDDLVKLRSAKSGVSKSFKLLGQGIIGLAVGIGFYIYFQKYLPSGTQLHIPIFKATLELGMFYPVFAALVIVASSNAVNLTDGLDGLVTGCLLIAGLAYLIIVYISGRFDYTAYLNVPYVPGAGELTVFAAAMVGSCLAFLWFNGFPAEIFMGNVGAVPLGGALGMLALASKQELVLFLVGAIFVMEALSVLLQVFSFRTTGKRIFKIAPLHHHYEFNGWSEPKIVLRFWITAAVIALIALATLKIEI